MTKSRPRRPRRARSLTSISQSARLQTEGQLGHHELVEAHAFGFRFAGQGGVKRLGDPDIELTAVFPPLRASRRFRKPVDQLIELAAFFRLSEGRTVPGRGEQACE